MTKHKEPPQTPIVIYEDAAGVQWVLVVCPYCQADLSKVSACRTVRTHVGELTETYWPLRCPECGHPLLRVARPSPIVRPVAPIT